MVSRPIAGPVRVTGDTFTHAQYGVGPATDYGVDINTVVRAPISGTVSRYWSDSGGWTVVIDGSDAAAFGQHNNGFEGPGPGEWAVEQAQVARSGNTGAVTTGPHSHWWIILNNGTRLSLEEYIASKGGALTPRDSYTPAGLSISSLNVRPITNIIKKKAIMSDAQYRTYIPTAADKAKDKKLVTEYYLVDVIYEPDGYRVTTDPKVADGFSSLVSNGSYIDKAHRDALPVAAKAAKDAFWAAEAKRAKLYS